MTGDDGIWDIIRTQPDAANSHDYKRYPLEEDVLRFSISTFLFVPFLSFALLSCAKPSMDVATVRKAIEDAEATFIVAFNRGDAAGVAALYTENATLLPPNSEIIQGRQGVQDFWTGGLQMGLKDVTLTTVDVGGSGDTAYSTGKYTLNIHQMVKKVCRTQASMSLSGNGRTMVRGSIT